jgi:hypothetical protein
MSYFRTKSGGLWGTVAQQKAVQKAAEASAAKRRKNHPDPQDMLDRSRRSEPSVAEVIANAVNYPSQTAYSQALNEAKRRERIAAGGPATVPKGKILGSDGKLRDATPKATDILVGGKVHTVEELSQQPQAAFPKQRKPRPRVGDEVEVELRGGARHTAKVTGQYDRFTEVQLQLSGGLGGGNYINIQHEPDALDHRIIRVKKRPK